MKKNFDYFEKFKKIYLLNGDSKGIFETILKRKSERLVNELGLNRKNVNIMYQSDLNDAYQKYNKLLSKLIELYFKYNPYAFRDNSSKKIVYNSYENLYKITKKDLINITKVDLGSIGYEYILKFKIPKFIKYITKLYINESMKACSMKINNYNLFYQHHLTDNQLICSEKPLDEILYESNHIENNNYEKNDNLSYLIKKKLYLPNKAAINIFDINFVFPFYICEDDNTLIIHMSTPKSYKCIDDESPYPPNEDLPILEKFIESFELYIEYINIPYNILNNSYYLFISIESRIPNLFKNYSEIGFKYKLCNSVL